MKSKHMAAIAGIVAALLLAIPIFASAHDGNNDRIPDRWEKSNDLSLNVNQAKRDQDHDGLRNKGEFRHGTDPRDADTDNDGVEDGAECVGVNNPEVDSDHDGVDDHAEMECEDHHHGEGVEEHGHHRGPDDHGRHRGEHESAHHGSSSDD